MSLELHGGALDQAVDAHVRSAPGDALDLGHQPRAVCRGEVYLVGTEEHLDGALRGAVPLPFPGMTPCRASPRSTAPVSA